MEELVFSRADAASYMSNRPGVGWRDLREWLELVERAGQLKRIKAEVDPREELSAITYMAARAEDAPALLFEKLAGDRFGARVLSNMLGASKERYALAVGHRSRPVDRRDDHGDPRDHAAPAPAGADRQGRGAGERDHPARRRDRRHRVPDADILARRRRPLYRHRRHHVHPRSATAGASTSASTGRWCMARPASASIARPASTAGSIARHRGRDGKTCEVVAAYGIDPVLFMVGGAGLQRERIRARGRRRHHGAADRADAGRVRQPADSRQCRAGDRGIAAPGRRGDGRAARRVHRLLRQRALAPAGDRGEGGALPPLADHDRGADGELSVMRDRRLLRDHALGPHPRRPAAHRRARRDRAPIRIRPRPPAGAW